MAIKGLNDLLKKYKEGSVNEEQFETELNKALPESWVPKTTFNELNDKYKLVDNQKKESDKLLTEAKNKLGETDELRTKYDSLVSQQKADREKYEADLKATRMTYAIENALTKAGARNIKATRALLDESRITFDDKGEILGLDDQVKSIRKDNDYLFSAPAPKPEQKVNPTFGDGGNPTDNPSDNAWQTAVYGAMGVK